MVKHLEDRDDLQHLLEELRQEVDSRPTPTALRAFGTVRALLSGKASEDIYVDEWPDWTVIIARPSERPKQQVAPALLPSVSIHSKKESVDHVNRTLVGALQWDQPCIFTSVPKWLEDFLMTSCTTCGSFLKLMECETMICTDTDLLERTTPVPGSYRLTTVMPSMAQEVIAHWRQNSQQTTNEDENSIQLVEYSSANFPSSCVIDKFQLPVAHVMCHYYGAIGMLGLSNDHKGHGLSAVVLHDLCRKLNSEEQPIWAHIEKGNLAAAELFCRSRFTLLKNSTTSWLAFTPNEGFKVG